MSKMLVLSLLLPFALAACSSGSSSNKNNGPAPLATEQSLQFTKTLDGIGRVQRVAQQGQIDSFKSSILKNISGSTTVTSGSNVNESAYVDGIFEDKMNTENCNISFNGLDGLSSPSTDTTVQPLDINIQMEVSGSECPISASYKVYFYMDMNPHSSSIGGSYSIDATFSITDDTLAQQNVVRALKMNGSGTFTMNVNQNRGQASFVMKGNTNGVATNYDGSTVTITNSVDGTITAVQAGKETATSGGLTVKTDFAYPSFTAELIESHNYTNKTVVDHYSLNGQDLTAEDYSNYLSQLGMLGIMSSGGAANSGNSMGQSTFPPQTSQPTPIQPTPSQPMPVPGNGIGACTQQLHVLRPYFTVDDLHSSCVNADASCVLYFAKAEPYYTPDDLHQACAN